MRPLRASGAVSRNENAGRGIKFQARSSGESAPSPPSALPAVLVWTPGEGKTKEASTVLGPLTHQAGRRGPQVSCHLGREPPSHQPPALFSPERPLFPNTWHRPDAERACSKHNTSRGRAPTEGLGAHSSRSLGKVREEGLLSLAWPLGVQGLTAFYV